MRPIAFAIDTAVAPSGVEALKKLLESTGSKSPAASSFTYGNAGALVKKMTEDAETRAKPLTMRTRLSPRRGRGGEGVNKRGPFRRARARAIERSGLRPQTYDDAEDPSAGVSATEMSFFKSASALAEVTLATVNARVDFTCTGPPDVDSSGKTPAAA